VRDLSQYTYKHVARIQEVAEKTDPHLEFVLNEERKSWEVEDAKFYGSVGALGGCEKLE
jgi:hypothetical protein